MALKYLLIFAAGCALTACEPEEVKPQAPQKTEKDKTMRMTKQPDPTTAEGYRTISGPLIRRAFVKKNGEPIDRMEYYIQRSIQDYFIKICEGTVDQSEFDKAYAKKDGDLPVIVKMDVEFKTGEWDKCGDEDVQSRTGEYVVVHRLY